MIVPDMLDARRRDHVKPKSGPPQDGERHEDRLMRMSSVATPLHQRVPEIVRYRRALRPFLSPTTGHCPCLVIRIRFDACKPPGTTSTLLPQSRVRRKRVTAIVIASTSGDQRDRVVLQVLQCRTLQHNGTDDAQ